MCKKCNESQWQASAIKMFRKSNTGLFLLQTWQLFSSNSCEDVHCYLWIFYPFCDKIFCSSICSTDLKKQTMIQQQVKYTHTAGNVSSLLSIIYRCWCESICRDGTQWCITLSNWPTSSPAAMVSTLGRHWFPAFEYI